MTGSPMPSDATARGALADHVAELHVAVDGEGQANAADEGQRDPGEP